MSHKPQKQRADEKRQPVVYDDDCAESLMQCFRIGQVEADRFVAVAAGDVPVELFTQGAKE